MKNNLKEIIKLHQVDVDTLIKTEVLTERLYDALYNYYADQMPYGTAKARDGDPESWIIEQFANDYLG